MFDDLKDKLAAFIANEVDETLDDGMVQKLAGEAIALVGAALVEAGNDIATELNSDGDAE